MILSFSGKRTRSFSIFVRASPAAFGAQRSCAETKLWPKDLRNGKTTPQFRIFPVRKEKKYENSKDYRSDHTGSVYIVGSGNLVCGGDRRCGPEGRYRDLLCSLPVKV